MAESDDSWGELFLLSIFYGRLRFSKHFETSLVLLEPMRTYEPFFWDTISAWMPVFKRLKSDSATFTIGKVFPYWIYP
jgi:hypothetical protein